MKKLVLVLVLLAVIAVACAPAPTPVPPTAAPKPTDAPKPTAVPPTAVPATKAPEPTKAVAPTTAPAPSGGTFRSCMRTGSMTGSLFTTNGHRLDGTINQVMAALKWTADGLQPLLAEKWEMLDGGKSWVINLRKNVKWHDGDPFDADDVVFTFNAYANPAVASTWASKVSGIQGYDEFQKGTATSLSGVKKIDSHTVRIDLKTPQPLWMQLDQIFIVILPEHILGKAKPSELRGHP